MIFNLIEMLKKRGQESPELGKYDVDLLLARLMKDVWMTKSTSFIQHDKCMNGSDKLIQSL